MAQRSRREFLEHMLLAGATAAAASPALRAFAEETPAGKSANERLGVACVGVKGRGGAHISQFTSRPDTEIRYIVDVDQGVGLNRVEEISKAQGGKAPKYVPDIRAMLEDKSVDIVSIATPNHWHSLHAIWAMQAGKDVYVEKPVSHNVSEGRRCVEAARKYNRICQTGTQSRSNPGMMAAMKFIHDGKLGKVKVARGLCYKPRPSIGPPGKYPVPTGVNYDLWLGPAPLLDYSPRKQFHYDWHWQWAYGAGDLGNQGIHQMDLCRWALGGKYPTSVLSYGGRVGYKEKDAGETANTQVVVQEYGDQSLVFEVRGLSTPEVRKVKVGIIIEGTEADLVMWSYNDGAAFDKSGNEIAKFKDGNDAHHFKNFIDGVRSRKHSDLHGDIEEGHISSALCHLGNISYRLGEDMLAADMLTKLAATKSNDRSQETFERTQAHLKENGVDLASTKLTLGKLLTFDGATEAFTGEGAAAANAMLTREYRAPYLVPAAGKV